MTELAYAALVLVLASLFLLGAGTVADDGLAHTGERTDISENFTPSVGVVTLENSNSDELTYSDDVTVKDKNGNHSIEGQDYLWHDNNGTVEVLAGGNLDGDNDASIDYTIWNPTQTDDDVGTVIADLVTTGSFIPLLLIVALVIGAVVVLGGLS